ncbi:hypothetical protein [Prochlorococcus marinus]|uniref:Uncharacterized protein n=1 Tax=Prochlorococcus marinus (strain MIT 9211) TaxID=93059 RepID=A9BA19_PROM4|nr:hypothetical protein [Prochlorococcus marinus]ABX08681.1 conserved hypothetical protein [Prochlorococcus marinus str. MIT 9211]
MSKELTHRGNELKELGWSEQDVLRYVELWDYRQRWGAINLERDDRLFLRKAESALPNISSSKPSVKKPINEKSYYRRISFFLDEMNKAEGKLSLDKDARGIWPILLEEELRALNYFQPVLGLPDTLKAKALTPFREELIETAVSQYDKHLRLLEFNFSDLASSLDSLGKKNWVPLREGINNNKNSYPVLDSSQLTLFRTEVRNKLIPLIRNTFPSLADSDKPNPPENWIPESDS